jgi:hypothetical protein
MAAVQEKIVDVRLREHDGVGGQLAAGSNNVI